MLEMNMTTKPLSEMNTYELRELVNDVLKQLNGIQLSSKAACDSAYILENVLNGTIENCEVEPFPQIEEVFGNITRNNIEKAEDQICLLTENLRYCVEG